MEDGDFTIDLYYKIYDIPMYEKIKHTDGSDAMGEPLNLGDIVYNVKSKKEFRIDRIFENWKCLDIELYDGSRYHYITNKSLRKYKKICSTM